METDLVFVAGFGTGVAGAAAATSIAMFLSWVVSISYIRKKFPELSFTVFPQKYSSRDMRAILKIGLPIGLNNSLFSFGHMAVQILVNEQGREFMAGTSVAGRITGLTNIAITAMSSAASTFAGQNYGAANYKRLRRGYIMIPAMSGLLTLSFGLMAISFRMPILRFFSQDEMVLLYASRYVVAILLSQWCFAVFSAISNIVNGVGYVRYTTVINLLMLCMIGYYLFSPTWKKVISSADA